jgi:hypothetical protein
MLETFRKAIRAVLPALQPLDEPKTFTTRYFRVVELKLDDHLVREGQGGRR